MANVKLSPREALNLQIAENRAAIIRLENEIFGCKMGVLDMERELRELDWERNHANNDT